MNIPNWLTATWIGAAIAGPAIYSYWHGRGVHREFDGVDVFFCFVGVAIPPLFLFLLFLSGVNDLGVYHRKLALQREQAEALATEETERTLRDASIFFS